MVETQQSEVARLRQQIEDEYLAAKRGLDGYAAVAQHTFIEARISNMGVSYQQLIVLVGRQEATKLFAETLEDLK